MPCLSPLGISAQQGSQEFPACPTLSEAIKARRGLLQIPSEVASSMPLPSMLIANLLRYKSFPPPLNPKTTTIRLYSPERPMLDQSRLRSLAVPAVAFTQNLLDDLNQALLGGHRSVVCPGHDALRLPFWILPYWIQICHAMDAQHEWAAAHDWLLKLSKEVTLFTTVAHDALNSFNQLGWDVPLQDPATHLRSRELVSFLSTEMVNGRVIDAMMNSIVQRVQHMPFLRDRVSVENLPCLTALRYDNERWEQYDCHRCFTRLRTLGNNLRAGSLQLLVIPINIADRHWTVFFVDGPTQSIEYGDSLGWSRPACDVERIQNWLRRHGLESFKDTGDLPHGVQLDGYSCAIAMVNIVQHSLFGDPLFTDAQKHFLRINEYLTLVRPSLMVSSFRRHSD
jgi:hypothetical protein